MSTEHDSPTNDNAGSANLHDNGGEVGGGLTTDDLANYLSNNDFVTKIGSEETQGGRKLTLFAEDEPEGNNNQDDVESDSSEEELDLDLLDEDSNDTLASEDEESEAEPVFEIQVDGKKFEVKQSELIADAQKYRSSKGRFEAASEMRKEADEIKASYQHDRDALKQALAQYQNFIAASYKEMEPDWDNLFHNDRLEYFTQKEIWEAKMEQVKQAQAYQAEIRRQEEFETKQGHEKLIQEQQKKLLELLPTWKNPEVAERDKTRMQAYLTQEGFSAQELDSILDARIVSVAHKAALYDQLVKANDQRKSNNKNSGKTLNAGTATTGDPGFAKRQAQTQAAREAKAWNDRFKSDQSVKTLEDYLFHQMTKKK